VTHVSDKQLLTGELTPRQKDILILVARGGTYRTIGQSLGIAGRTVQNMSWQLRTALGVENMAQAVVVALRRYLITLDDIYPPLKLLEKEDD